MISCTKQKLVSSRAIIITIFIFRNYECYIQTNDDKNKFAIDLCNSAISFRRVEEPLRSSVETQPAVEPKPHIIMMCESKQTHILTDHCGLEYMGVCGLNFINFPYYSYKSRNTISYRLLHGYVILVRYKK